MSENKPKPESKDRTALYIAIVGATATIIAAMVGVLPNLLNRGAAPTPIAIVITATPAPTQVSQATTVPPTIAPATSFPSTATTAAPTATLVPPTAMTVPPSPTPAVKRIDFILTNNREGPFDFYIDNEYQITVPPGGYQRLRVIPGEHELTHCPRGEKSTDLYNDCETLAREVRNNPYDWTLGGTIPARDEVLLFLLNQIDRDVDIYVNGAAFVPVDAHQIGTFQFDPGTVRLQSCPRGATPEQGVCGAESSFEFLHNVEMYVVNVP